MSKYLGTLALFQMFGHDILNIVHVLTTIRFLAGSALQYTYRIIEGQGHGVRTMDYNLAADGNSTCFRHFVPERNISSGMDMLIYYFIRKQVIFVFVSAS